MKKFFIKIFIFFAVIFLCPKVFASEFNMNAYTSATKNGTKNRYRATEIYNYGTSNTYTFGTQYNGRISDIETYFDYPFSANLTYTLTYNMNTDDFRNTFGSSYWWYCDQEMTNTNAHVVLPSYINYKKVKLSFTTDEAATCIRVWLRSSNITSTAITGVSNWRLNNITIYDPEWQDGTTSGSGSQGTTSGSQGTTPNNTNQDIIDNSNQNTQDIINNNNQNTQQIIDSNKNNLNVCYFNYFNIMNMGYYSTNTGTIDRTDTQTLLITSTLAGRTDVLSTTLSTIAPDLQVGETYILNYDAYQVENYIYLTSGVVWQKGQSHTITQSDLNSNVAFYTKTPLTSGTYKRITIQKSTGNYSYNWFPYGEDCVNRIDSTNQSINEVNNSINNDNVDSGVGSDFFSDFQDNSHGLTGIITAPLNAISSITSSTCQPLSIPIPFTNGSVSLPCMTQVYQDNIPTIYNIWKVVSFGIIAYFICVDIFHIVKGFKDPESDKVEVLDL